MPALQVGQMSRFTPGRRLVGLDYLVVVCRIVAQSGCTLICSRSKQADLDLAKKRTIALMPSTHYRQ